MKRFIGVITLLSFLLMVQIHVCLAKEVYQQKSSDKIDWQTYSDSSSLSEAKQALEQLQHERAAGLSHSQRKKRKWAEWDIARALWNADPTTQTAQEIIQLARMCEGQHKYSLFALVDESFGRQLMTKEERLLYLLRYKIFMRVGYPEALEILLTPQTSHDQLIQDSDDRTFLDRHHGEVVPSMQEQFDKNGSASAALILGYFKDDASLPALKKWFVESEGFYGWESTIPDELDYNQFPKHHCYEEAIEHITGQPIEKAIVLTQMQISQLVARYRQGSKTALYVLFRLKPEVAFQEASQKFRAVKSEKRLPLCVLMNNYFLQKKISATEIQKILGEPDIRQKRIWSYDCGVTIVKERAALIIEFKNKKVNQTTVDTM